MLRAGPGAGGMAIASIHTSMSLAHHSPAEPPPYQLGVGHYRARRIDDKIVLHAVGETPAPNYRVWLRKAGTTDVADYELWWRPPGTGGISLATPFDVHVTFRTGLHADLVRMRDATGVHHVHVEPVFGAEAAASATALVAWHLANQFDLHYSGKDIGFTHANVAGDPLMNYGAHFFYGDQIERLDAPIGELVTVTLAQRSAGERWRLSLLLPRTWVSSYETSTIEALVIESVVHGHVHGPPAGQEVVYERVNKVTGEASFIFS
jgi:hypothetical protein